MKINKQGESTGLPTKVAVYDITGAFKAVSSGGGGPEVDPVFTSWLSTPVIPIFAGGGDLLVKTDNTGLLSTVDYDTIANGGQTAVFYWRFDTSTSATDPGTGKFQFDQTTVASITNIYVDDITFSAGIDISALFSAIDGDWLIHIQETATAANFVQFTTSTPYIDNTGWWTIPVTYVQNGGLPFAMNNRCAFVFINQNGASSVTPSALTKTDDTNVTLTLGGSPSVALLAATSLTLGWTGTLADGRIASASNWNTAFGWGNHASAGYLTTSAAAAAYQPLDSDLTAIAALTPTNDDIIQRKAGAWTNRSMTQLKVDLGVSGSNTGDQTISITGDVTAAGSTSALSATVTKINGVSLAGLATGILKNTTGTGVPSIAAAGTDYVAPNGAISGNTRMKITYDSKGLVTAGATAASTDLSDVTEWTDYSATSTIVGFSAFTVKDIRYKIVGKSMYIVYHLDGTGSGTATTFTLPFSIASVQDVVWLSHTKNNTTQAASYTVVASGGSTVTFSNTASDSNTGTWTNAVVRFARGQAVLPLP